MRFMNLVPDGFGNSDGRQLLRLGCGMRNLCHRHVGNASGVVQPTERSGQLFQVFAVVHGTVENADDCHCFRIVTQENNVGARDNFLQALADVSRIPRQCWIIGNKAKTPGDF